MSKIPSPKLINLERAREFLGDASGDYTDAEVLEIVDLLRIIAEAS